MDKLKYMLELEQRYHELKRKYDKATELIDVAARCMDDCDYAMTKVSNSRVEEAISVWNEAYGRFKEGINDEGTKNNNENAKKWRHFELTT